MSARDSFVVVVWDDGPTIVSEEKRFDLLFHFIHILLTDWLLTGHSVLGFVSAL
jgi:hypothetical protein